jgi:ribose transport system ATP-binding protein
MTMIHQELALIPQLTVGQNIFLGREPRRKLRGLIDWPRLYQQARAELDRLGLQIAVDRLIVDLSIAQRQLVEIAKALSYRARLIVLDEPTIALTDREANTLFGLMRSLRSEVRQGATPPCLTSELFFYDLLLEMEQLDVPGQAVETEKYHGTD